MKVDLIECTVRLNLDGNPNLAEIVRAGKNAARATEIPVLRAMHDLGMGDESDCSIFNARVIGQAETTRAQEIAFLKSKYKQKYLDLVYPGGRGLPEKLEHCELPAANLAKRGQQPKSDRAEVVEKAG